MVKPNFKRAKEEAYKTLMLQENFSFPINPKNIKLKDGTICLLYGNFSKPMKRDFIFHTDYSRLNDGKYQLDFFNNIRVKDNRLI